MPLQHLVAVGASKFGHGVGPPGMHKYGRDKVDLGPHTWDWTRPAGSPDNTASAVADYHVLPLRDALTVEYDTDAHCTWTVIYDPELRPTLNWIESTRPWVIRLESGPCCATLSAHQNETPERVLLRSARPGSEEIQMVAHQVASATRRPTLIVLDPLDGDYSYIGGSTLSIIESPWKNYGEVVMDVHVSGEDWLPGPDVRQTLRLCREACFITGRQDDDDSTNAMERLRDHGQSEVADLLADAGWDVICLGAERPLKLHFAGKKSPVIAVLRRGATMQIGSPKLFVDMSDPWDPPQAHLEHLDSPGLIKVIPGLATIMARALKMRPLRTGYGWHRPAPAVSQSGLTFDIDGDMDITHYMSTMSKALCSVGVNVIEIHTEYFDVKSRVLESNCRAFDKPEEP